MFYRQVIWNFAGKTSVWSWRNWTGRDCFGGCCHQTPHLCVAMETETGNDDRDQCFKGGGAKDLQEGQKEGSWKGKDEEGIRHLLRNQRLLCVCLSVSLFVSFSEILFCWWQHMCSEKFFSVICSETRLIEY